jgi:hypothetical protein
MHSGPSHAPTLPLSVSRLKLFYGLRSRTLAAVLLVEFVDVVLDSWMSGHFRLGLPSTYRKSSRTTDGASIVSGSFRSKQTVPSKTDENSPLHAP